MFNYHLAGMTTGLGAMLIVLPSLDASPHGEVIVNGVPQQERVMAIRIQDIVFIKI
jgi:hypothetical protein